jgi:hypothetical protein
VLAVAVRPGESQAAPADLALLSALDAAAKLAVAAHNRQHPDQTVLKTLIENKGRIHYLANEQRFPPGLRPAFGLQAGYLILASSPEVLRRFGGEPPPVLQEAQTAEFPLLRLSIRACRQFVVERYDPLADYVAQRNQQSRKDAEQRLDGLLKALRLFDRVELSQRAQPGLLHLVLRIRLEQALK